MENQITFEEKKSGITDPTHFAYPTFAKAARQRADNLQVSVRELKVQQDAAELALEEVQAEFAKAAALEERDSGALACAPEARSEVLLKASRPSHGLASSS